MISFSMVIVSNIKKLFICCVIQQIFGGHQALGDELLHKIIQTNLALRLLRFSPRTVILCNSKATLCADLEKLDEMRAKLHIFNPNVGEARFILSFFTEETSFIYALLTLNLPVFPKPILCMPFFVKLKESSIIHGVLTANPICRANSTLAVSLLQSFESSGLTDISTSTSPSPTFYAQTSESSSSSSCTKQSSYKGFHFKLIKHVCGHCKFSWQSMVMFGANNRQMIISSQTTEEEINQKIYALNRSFKIGRRVVLLFFNATQTEMRAFLSNPDANFPDIVYAFEPKGEIRKILTQNISDSDLHRVISGKLDKYFSQLVGNIFTLSF